MQFEDFDKKIKEAADHHHPAYNEDAWGKMEKLLNKHMPEKKDDRRRFIFFILIPLLLAGSAALFIIKPWETKKAIAKTEIAANSADSSMNSSTSTAINDKKEEPGIASQDQLTGTTTDRKNTETPVAETEIAKPQVLSQGQNNSIGNNNQQFDATVNSPATKKKKSKQPAVAITDMPVDVISSEVKKPAQMSPIVKQDEIKSSDTDKTTINPTANGEIKAEDKKEETQTTNDKKEEVAEANPPAKNAKSSGKKRNSFFISASAGPDVSSVGADRPGKIKIVAGFGIGYTFKERFTIRTGFYTARKIYTADKEDYKPAANPPNLFYLDKIYADCKVYEIPLSLTYHFGKSQKHNFFGSAGVSSYLMKEEVYDYLYKYPGNPPVTYSHTYSYKKENNHYFSVVGISAGYQRNISNAVSIMAEPYVRIPVSGVGNGNVKLNSAGVMLTIGYKPFNAAKKK